MTIAAPTSTAAPSSTPTGTTILVLDRVSLRDRNARRGVSRGGLNDLHLHRGAGVIAILGAPEDGSMSIVELLSGQRRPDRGRVLVNGRAPHADPSLRARIGVLGHAADLPPGPTVQACVSAALSARGDLSSRAAVVLDEAGLAGLGSRATTSLSFGEARSIELALALTVRDPALVVLSEPFSEIGAVPTDFVLERIKLLARHCVVVVVTSSPADARRVLSGAPSDLLIVLHQGSFARDGTRDGELVFPRRSEIIAWVETELRPFVKHLADEPSVLGISWEPIQSRGDLESGTVRVVGSDPIALALAISDASVATSALVAGISEAEPTLAEVRTATESIRHAAYAPENASRRAAGPGAAQISPHMGPRASQLPRTMSESQSESQSPPTDPDSEPSS